MKITEIQKIADDVRQRLLRASAHALPNNPSERGMKADDIRKHFYQSILNASDSLLSEQNRMADETNQNLLLIAKLLTALEALCGITENENGEPVSDALLTEAKTIVEAINEIERILRRDENGDKEVMSGATSVFGYLQFLEKEVNDRLKIEWFNRHKNLLAHNSTPRKDLNDPHEMRWAISIVKNELMKKYILPNSQNIQSIKATDVERDQRIQENAANIEKSKESIKNAESKIANLESKNIGFSRRFVLENFSQFILFIRGEYVIETANGRVHCEDLITGDDVFLIEHHAADFWYQQTSDADMAETYVYDGIEYELIVRDSIGEIKGLFHVNETDYNIIEDQVTSARFHAISAKEANEAASKDRAAVESLVNSIFYIQKAPKLEHIDNALMLPTPTLAMLSDGMI